MKGDRSPVLGGFRTTGNKNFSLFVKEINKMKRSIGQYDAVDIFKMKWRGHTFNCLPFLLNGASYLDTEFRSMLCDSVARLDKTVEPVELSEIESIENVDFDVLYSLIPDQGDFGIKYMCTWHYKNHPKEVVRLLFVGYLYVMQECIFDNKWRHYDFMYKDICNTQAFCYYLGVAWILGLNPLLSKLLNKELRQCDFYKVLDNLCPEGCIHDRYIKGEITSKELSFKYNESSFADGSSICNREVISNCTSGSYEGEDLTSREIGFADDYMELVSSDFEYSLNMHLAYCLLFDGTYGEMKKSIKENELTTEYLKEKTNKANVKMNLAKDEIKQLKTELSKKDAEIQSLRCELKKRPPQKELKSEIDSLKSKLRQLEAENNSLFDERLRLKQEISVQKKKLRNRISSPLKNDDAAENLSQSGVDTPVFNLEDAISLLKDKRYVIVGGEFIKGLDIKLNEYGFSSIKYATKNTKTLGNYDYLILITKICHHSDVYHVEKLAKNDNSVIVYFNGVNAEQLLKQLYELEVESC